MVVWRFEHRTFYISSLRIKLILACQEVLWWVWPPMNQKRLLFHSNWNTASKHAPQVERVLLILYEKPPMENHRRPTPNEKSFELQDNLTISSTRQMMNYRKTWNKNLPACPLWRPGARTGTTFHNAGKISCSLLESLSMASCIDRFPFFTWGVELPVVPEE